MRVEDLLYGRVAVARLAAAVSVLGAPADEDSFDKPLQRYRTLIVWITTTGEPTILRFEDGKKQP